MNNNPKIFPIIFSDESLLLVKLRYFNCFPAIDKIIVYNKDN